VKLKELNGTPVDLSEYNGKTVFINFWATWCKPCIQEMPTIAEVQKLKGDVVFLLASNEDPSQIEKFMKRHDYDFHYVHLENMEALKIPALPTTFIFNPEGKLKFAEAGLRMWDDPANIELINSITNDDEK
jgi:thiol-disulfide isomerase/thioredoxin